MGLFSYIFGNRPRAGDANVGQPFEALTAYRPAFTSWRGQMYESELIRATVDALARHISKGKVEFRGAAKPALKTYASIRPNSFQTWSQFLYRLATIYYCTNNAIIVPVLNDYGETCGYFPVLPSSCEVVDAGGEPYLRYHFQNGKTAAVELSKCGLMRRHQLNDDFFGESNAALNETLSMLDMQAQGIREGIKNGATFRFIARLSNFAKPEDISKERRRFNAENLQGESSGILLFPNTYNDIKQIESKPYLVDSAQQALIQKNVQNYFGVSEKVIQSAAIGDELNALFDGSVEPFFIQLSEVMTLMTYTVREINTHNEVYVTANRLQYMSTSEKITLAKEIGAMGALYIDEIRELFNYAPLPDGLGQHLPARGEFYLLDKGKDKTAEDGAQDSTPDDSEKGTDDNGNQ